MVNRNFVVAFIALLGFAMPGFSQAILEYGTIAAGTSTNVAATGSRIGKQMKVAGDALGNKMSESQAKGNDAAKSRTSAPNFEEMMLANKQKLESAAGANGATVRIATVPTKAAIYVDGLAVAYAPADVRLAAGKHVVELRRPAFMAWRTEVTLAAGETLRLEPKLAADPKQVVVSFK